jgi:NAD(P)-dependent dehydrogenase (short-subunit alcohol dehydrogenase family)
MIDFPRVADKLAMMAVEHDRPPADLFLAREKDAGRRCDLEAGMAKLLGARVAWAAPTTPCRSMAATASRWNTDQPRAVRRPHPQHLRGRRRNPGLETVALDYTDPASIAACADSVLALTDGKLDALFNNGAYGQPGLVEDLPTDVLRAQFEANFFGWHDLTTRFCRPCMHLVLRSS